MRIELFKNKWLNAIAWVIIIALIITPGILFIYKFGFKLSNEISGWNNTANYFNSVYTPIFAFLAVIGVLITYRDQSRANKISEFAFVSVYFKDKLKDLIASLDKTRLAIDGVDIVTKLDEPNYKENITAWLPVYDREEKMVRTQVGKFLSILTEMTNYDFITKPEVIFVEEFNIIVSRMYTLAQKLKNWLGFLKKSTYLDPDGYVKLGLKDKIEILENRIKTLEYFYFKYNQKVDSIAANQGKQ